MALSNDPKGAEQYGADELLASEKDWQKQSNKRNKMKTKATDDTIPSENTGNSSAEKDVSKNSGEETEMPHHGSDGTASIRQRRRVVNAKSLSRVSDRKETSSSGQKALAQTKQNSFFLEVAIDIWTWLNGSFRFLRACYPILKWLVVGYLVWMGLSYSLASIYYSVASKLSPVCSDWKLGSSLPFCNWFPDVKSQAIDVSKVATAQEGLTVVMDRVGENFDLAREMTGHEFAVRDLRIRVAVSGLSRREELARELILLSTYTRKTAKDLSRFTARVSKSIDAVYVFDKYSVKALEAIAERERYIPTLPEKVLSALSPLAAFAPSIADQSEERVKHLLIYTADKISNKVRVLIEDSYQLDHSLEKIQSTLDGMKELVAAELGDLPRTHILKALWNHLARSDDYEQLKSHTTLLEDMTEFYKRSSSVMKETVAALNHIEAELSEFRDDYTTPVLILINDPLEVIIELLKKSGQRLETGWQKLESIEWRARRQKD